MELHARDSVSGGTLPCICIKMAFIFLAVSGVHSWSFSESAAVGSAVANTFTTEPRCSLLGPSK